MTKHLRELELDSHELRDLCRELDTTTQDPNALWQLDLQGGGFMFSDEVPTTMMVPLEKAILTVGLMRYLWAYRASLVRGKPIDKFEPYWELTKRIAPNWVGFAQARCSSDASPILRECDRRIAIAIAEAEKELGD